MENRYVLDKEVENLSPAQQPYLYTYEEAVEYIKTEYGFAEPINDEVADNQARVIEWIIDEDFTIINDEESYSWYEAFGRYELFDDNYDDSY